MRRYLAFLLSLLMVIALTNPLLANNDDIVTNDLEIDELIEDNNPIEIVEDAPYEELELEIIEISEDFDPNQPAIGSSPIEYNSDSPRIMTRSMIPSKFDLRKNRMVTPVRDQGENGSCWAFAAYGSMESVLLRAGKGMYDFSEKHMRNMHGFDWSITKGGNRDMATAYLASGKGPVAEVDDPYDPVISYSDPSLRRMMDIDRVLYLPDVNDRNEVDSLKWAISEYGGVYSTVNISRYYENKTHNSMYNPVSVVADHAVTIVGWDDNFPANYFTQKPPGNGAWICKNSWGSDYLDGGYYYVSYYDKLIGKSPTVFIPRKKDLRGIIHQYDPLGATRSVGFGGEGYMANIFKANYDELLHNVGFYNVSNQLEYEIYVVRDLKSTSDMSDNRIKIGGGNLLYPGYYNIKVDPVQLHEEEQFAIVMYMRSPNNRTPLPIETQIAGYTSKAVGLPGQSFYSSTGNGWTDLTTSLPNANFCLKAITTTGKDVPDYNIDDHDTDITIDDKPQIRRLGFNLGCQGYIAIDKKGKLDFSYEPEDAEAEFVFGSLDEDICVFRDGIVYPVKPGNTNVFVETKDKSIIARFNIQVVNPGIKVPGRQAIPVIGINHYVPPEPEPEPEPEIPDDIEPEPIKPEKDPSIPRSIFNSIRHMTMIEGTTFAVENRIGVYPDTAIRDFIYYSDRPDIVEARPDGILVARDRGTAVITVLTDNGLKTTFTVRVDPDLSKQIIEITEITPSERKAGVFTVSAKATVDGRPYEGPGYITEKSGDRVKEKFVYFKRGEGSVTWTGFTFGVWRRDFEAEVRIRNIIKNISFNY